MRKPTGKCWREDCAEHVINYRKYCDEHNPARAKAQAEDYLVTENKRLRARVAELEART